mmetsp:Transcript_4128/g.4578  ORF Transcript_4128/g.4578 Transcript_4128/m.4578 type:complete len:242 (-) Transcript_4128:106-831(-)
MAMSIKLGLAKYISVCIPVTTPSTPTISRCVPAASHLMEGIGIRFKHFSLGTTPQALANASTTYHPARCRFFVFIVIKVIIKVVIKIIICFWIRQIACKQICAELIPGFFNKWRTLAGIHGKCSRHIRNFINDETSDIIITNGFRGVLVYSKEIDSTFFMRSTIARRIVFPDLLTFRKGTAINNFLELPFLPPIEKVDMKFRPSITQLVLSTLITRYTHKELNLWKTMIEASWAFTVYLPI